MKRFIIIVLVGLVLVSCGTKKQTVKPQPEPEPQVPSWHTCLIQNARATVNHDGEKMSANVTMQTVRDSMLVISIMPMLGIEMLRLEATPTEMVAIDKIHGQYAQSTYAEVNRKVTPNINWDVLQQLCSAELPTGSQRARLVYTFDNESLEIVVEYPERKIDVPVRVTHQPVNKYTQIDLRKWL